jgi:hypothetical protein
MNRRGQQSPIVHLRDPQLVVDTAGSRVRCPGDYAYRILSSLLQCALVTHLQPLEVSNTFQSIVNDKTMVQDLYVTENEVRGNGLIRNVRVGSKAYQWPGSCQMGSVFSRGSRCGHGGLRGSGMPNVEWRILGRKFFDQI